ncbi:MAG: hypothetical protein K0U20_02925 [Proteobacteria bacterium]|nr:hypothetical protein [Pseudomonadota bacterium]
MEFFEHIQAVELSVVKLQEILTISNSVNLCVSISEVLDDQQYHGRVYCVWGEFTVNRELLAQGVRFSMPSCPNALAWTLTLDADKVLSIHCTINKQKHDQEFIESIQEFTNDWKSGLEHYLV